MRFSSLSLVFLTTACSRVLASQSQDQRNIFAFGSSWSDLSFQQSGRQPSPASPFGNPPEFNNSDNQEGGPNFLRYLTEVYNSTTTLLYDLARGGATINNNIVNGSGVPDLLTQVGKNFTPQYSCEKDSAWYSSNTIFNVWMIDNDVNDGYNNTNYNNLTNYLMHSYWDVAIDQLYREGARKFMFVSCPAQERSPLLALEDPKVDLPRYLALKWQLDDALYARYKSFKARHRSDVEATFFNSSAWLNPLLDDPTRYGFDKNATCLPPTTNCIWNNDFHLVPEAHKLMAEAILPHYKELGF